VFPTAGGDAGEIERMGLIGALWSLIEQERIKVYSCDSVAGRSWLVGADPRHSAWLQDQFDGFIHEELVPAIRTDCSDGGIEVITAGASIGAFNAVASLCRHPWTFRAAIGMSGTYDLSAWLHGTSSDDVYYSSPLHFLPGLEGEQLDQLRRRFVVLAAGRGRWENPGETWKMAHALGSKSIPNRVDLWGDEHDHDWPTWAQMLPLYLDDLA
jgi:esterase/lipase superfamily enzyme